MIIDIALVLLVVAVAVAAAAAYRWREHRPTARGQRRFLICLAVATVLVWLLATSYTQLVRAATIEAWNSCAYRPNRPYMRDGGRALLLSVPHTRMNTMHACPVCGMACDCDGEAVWSDSAAAICIHPAEYNDEDKMTNQGTTMTIKALVVTVDARPPTVNHLYVGMGKQRRLTPTAVAFRKELGFIARNAAQ